MLGGGAMRFTDDFCFVDFFGETGFVGVGFGEIGLALKSVAFEEISSSSFY